MNKTADLATLPEITEDHTRYFEQVANTYGIEFLDWLKGISKDGSDFVVEQATLLCSDIINWEFYSNLASCLFGVILASLCLIGIIYLVRYLHKYGKNKNHEVECITSFYISLGLVVGFLICIFGLFGEHIRPTIKAAVAPRLVIIDYIKEAVK